MERQAQPLGEEEVVVALRQFLIVARGQLYLRVPDPPHVLRVEDEPILKPDARAVEVVSPPQIDSLRSVAAEEPDNGRQLLVEADPDTFSNLIGSRIVRSEPDTVAALREGERREGVAHLGQREQRVRQIGRVDIALLQPELQTKTRSSRRTRLPRRCRCRCCRGRASGCSREHR